MSKLFVSYTAICKVPGTEGVRVFKNTTMPFGKLVLGLRALRKVESQIAMGEFNLRHVRILYWRRMEEPEEGSDAPD